MERTMLNGSRLFGAVAVVLTITGCVSQKPIIVAQLFATQAQEPLVRDFKRLSTECWQRDPAFFREGIRVRAYNAVQGSAVFTLSRWSPGSGSYPPFFTIEISLDDSGSLVLDVRAIKDGSGDEYLDDTRRWLSGDLTCRE